MQVTFLNSYRAPNLSDALETLEGVTGLPGSGRARDGGVEVLGPAPAPLALLRGRYRYRLLMKTPRETHIQRLLHEWLDGVSPSGGLRVQIDVDPYSFM